MSGPTVKPLCKLRYVSETSGLKSVKRSTTVTSLRNLRLPSPTKRFLLTWLRVIRRSSRYRSDDR